MQHGAKRPTCQAETGDVRGKKKSLPALAASA